MLVPVRVRAMAGGSKELWMMRKVEARSRKGSKGQF